MIDTGLQRMMPKSKQLQFAKINLETFVNDNLSTMVSMLKTCNSMHTDIFTEDLALQFKQGKFEIVINPKSNEDVIAQKYSSEIKHGNLSLTDWAKKILQNYRIWLKRRIAEQKKMNALELNNLLKGEPKTAVFSRANYADYVLANLATPISELSHTQVANINFNITSDVNTTYLACDNGYFGQHLVANLNSQQQITTSMFNHIIEYLTNSDYFAQHIHKRQIIILLLINKLNNHPDSIINDGQEITTYDKIINLSLESSQEADFYSHIALPLDVLGDLIGKMSINSTFEALSTAKRANVDFIATSDSVVDNFVVNILNDYHSVNIKYATKLLNKMHKRGVKFNLSCYKNNFMAKSQTITKYFNNIYDLNQLNQLIQTIISLAE